jgi:hypothetical protein
MSTDVSDVRAASIIRAMIVALMMEAVCTSETSVYFYETTSISQKASIFTSPPLETEISLIQRCLEDSCPSLLHI